MTIIVHQGINGGNTVFKNNNWVKLCDVQIFLFAINYRSTVHGYICSYILISIPLCGQLHIAIGQYFNIEHHVLARDGRCSYIQVINVHISYYNRPTLTQSQGYREGLKLLMSVSVVVMWLCSLPVTPSMSYGLCLYSSINYCGIRPT